MDNSFYRGMPKPVFQSSRRLCWAAALESWLDAVPNRPSYDQDYLVLEGTVLEHVTDEGDLKKAGLHWIAARFHVKFKAFAYNRRLKADFLIDRLRKRGHIYMGFNQPSTGGVGHAQVVWGASADYGTMYVMDPWEGRGYQVYSLPTDDDTPTEFLVGWPSH